MWVAIGMKDQLLADMINVCIAMVSRVTITWANYLFIMLSSLLIWISREKVESTMPLKFQRFCPNISHTGLHRDRPGDRLIPDLTVGYVPQT